MKTTFFQAVCLLALANQLQGYRRVYSGIARPVDFKITGMKATGFNGDLNTKHDASAAFTDETLGAFEEYVFSVTFGGTGHFSKSGLFKLTSGNEDLEATFQEEFTVTIDQDADIGNASRTHVFAAPDMAALKVPYFWKNPKYQAKYNTKILRSGLLLVVKNWQGNSLVNPNLSPKVKAMLKKRFGSEQPDCPVYLHVDIEWDTVTYTHFRNPMYDDVDTKEHKDRLVEEQQNQVADDSGESDVPMDRSEYPVESEMETTANLVGDKDTDTLLVESTHRKLLGDNGRSPAGLLGQFKARLENVIESEIHRFAQKQGSTANRKIVRAQSKGNLEILL